MGKDELFDKTDHPTYFCLRNLVPIRVQSVIANLWHRIEQFRSSAFDQVGRLNRVYDLGHVFFCDIQSVCRPDPLQRVFQGSASQSR
jgi:hypothetical protein